MGDACDGASALGGGTGSTQCTVEWFTLSDAREGEESFSFGGSGGDDDRDAHRVSMQLTRPPGISESFLDRFRVERR